jgi:hypothetical protein
MKKNYYLLLLVLVLSASVNAQTQWKEINLDEKILVKFPSAPEKKTANGIINFVAKTKDSVTFTASVIDYQVIAKIDSAGLAALKDTKGFADQLKAGISAQRKDYVLGDVKVDKWRAYTTYQLLGTKSNDNKKLHLKMIIIGSKMYSLSCLVPAQLETRDTEIFLDSLEFITQ